ncbi:MAG TPA: hypothetical protein VMJ10_26070, partial [Kofleriaceae bacterium]|nr:hypothetical protein [Kofleriaceae bacterium]
MLDARASYVPLHRRKRAAARESVASRIAVHEAGHAVMAYLCRRRVGGASAVPHGGILGQLEYGGVTTFPTSWLEDARARRKLENEIMIALAGLAAEYVQPGIVDHAGAAADLARALEIALPAISDPEEATAFINWLFVRARNRLREPSCRRAIKAL